jgi:phosphohistidine swiveling domain-containing protein
MSPLGQISDYTRLFRVQGLRYFINDIWTEHYKTLEVLTIVMNDEFTSYLPNSVVTRTRKEGADLLGSPDAFDQYEREFREYMEEFRTYAASLDFSTISRAEVKKLMDDVARLFYFYSKTEFFYTDGAYELFEATKDSTLENRLERWGKLKNEGREFLNSIFFGAAAVLPRLWQAFAERFDVAERVLQQYTQEEILDLYDGKTVAEDEIKRRDDVFYVKGIGESRVCKTGADARKDVETFLGEGDDGAQEILKGKTANKGIVRGRVSVFKMGYDTFHTLTERIDAMAKGDILIAETTSPEYITACQKAAAIVTDQGGMLSHAAIVSREMNIPCVVGTGNATGALHTGDLVEVDADKGEVRIIEKARR